MLYHYKIKDVVRVIDGDTIEVVIDLGFDISIKEKLRLANIDAPELQTKDKLEKKLAIEAMKYLKKWLKSQTQLYIRTSKDDKYGRILGEIFGDNGICINQLLLENSYAWKYDGNVKNKDLTELIKNKKENK
jgi:micrococcal nuclease